LGSAGLGVGVDDLAHGGVEAGLQPVVVQAVHPGAVGPRQRPVEDVRMAEPLGRAVETDIAAAATRHLGRRGALALFVVG